MLKSMLHALLERSGEKSAKKAKEKWLTKTYLSPTWPSDRLCNI